jgi:putative pre-16S rRNA nuclease
MAARILAIDFGMKRIGLAVSDELGVTAQGLETLERTRTKDDLARIASLAEEYAVERIIMGNPIGHSGKETSMSKQVAEFAEKLRKRVPCPVELVDERLTSAEANRFLHETGASRGKARRAVDRVAATLILANYLDRRSNETERARRSATPA